VTRTYRILIVVVVLAATAGAYWMLLLSPKRKDAADLQKQVAVAQAEVAQSKATLATYEQSREAYKQNYETVVRLGKALPDDDDTRSLLVQLDATSKRAGVNFANIDVLQAGSAGTSVASDANAPADGAGVIPGAINGGSFSQMPFSFGFTGTFGSLSDFFGRVNRFVTIKGDSIQVNGRLLRIDSIDVKPGAGGWPAIQAQIGASTYIVPQTGATAQSPAGGTAPPGTAATGTSTSTSSSPESTQTR
jgi:hypothetical protein